MSARRAWLIVLLVSVGTALLVPASASAATCADHPNQASAQRAKDTRDADGDGIYCEALPCPCLKPGDEPGGGGDRARPRPRPRQRATTLSARITAVIDGDTVRVRTTSGRRYTVRLIGIDTPETKKPGTAVECGGREATANMLRLAFSAPTDANGDGLLDQQGGVGRSVRLTTDPTQDRFDRYRRLLAYVRTSSAFLNEAQVSSGWATVYVYQGKAFRELGRLRRTQETARAAGRGVWGKCGGDFHRPAAAAAATATRLLP